MEIVFKKASRQASFLKIGMMGNPGAGKTFSALRLAKGFTKETGGRTCVICSEGGAAQVYGGDFDYDVFEMPAPFTPERMIGAIHGVVQAGYEVLIIDSISAEWSGSGGILEELQIVSRRFRGNSFVAWGELSPRHRAFVETIRTSPIHIIATMRQKSKSVPTKGAGGKSELVYVGEVPDQRPGIEYEFDIFFEIEQQGHTALALKNRTNLKALQSGKRLVIDEAFGADLYSWYTEGSAPGENAWRPSPSFERTVHNWTERAKQLGDFNVARELAEQRLTCPHEKAFMLAHLGAEEEMFLLGKGGSGGEESVGGSGGDDLGMQDDFLNGEEYFDSDTGEILAESAAMMNEPFDAGGDYVGNVAGEEIDVDFDQALVHEVEVMGAVVPFPQAKGLPKNQSSRARAKVRKA